MGAGGHSRRTATASFCFHPPVSPCAPQVLQLQSSLTQREEELGVCRTRISDLVRPAAKSRQSLVTVTTAGLVHVLAFVDQMCSGLLIRTHCCVHRQCGLTVQVSCHECEHRDKCYQPGRLLVPMPVSSLQCLQRPKADLPSALLPAPRCSRVPRRGWSLSWRMRCAHGRVLRPPLSARTSSGGCGAVLVQPHTRSASSYVLVAEQAWQ